jgi:hypothetical protein
MAEHSLFAPRGSNPGSASQFDDPSQSQSDPMDAETFGQMTNPAYVPPASAAAAVPAAPDLRSAAAKRARIDPTVATPGEQSLSPLAAAKAHIEEHCASLREGIATILTTRGLEHITLCHKRFHRERAWNKVKNDDDYIPTSARVNFRPSVWKEAEQLPEYTELQAEIKVTIEKHQQDLKLHVIAAIKIECKALTLAVNKHLCCSLSNVASLFLLAQGVDTTRVNATVTSILDQHGAVLLEHNAMDSTEFKALYMTTLGVDCSPEAPVYEPAGNSDSIKRAIEAVFVEAWKIYKSQAAENELSLTLKKEAKATLLSEKTEAATMEIDTELPVDRIQLQELIRKEATKVFKSQPKEPKNGTRGQPSGASKKKKSKDNLETKKKETTTNSATKKAQRQNQTPSNETANSRTRARRKQRDRRAEGAADDTPSDSGNNRGSRSKQHSRKNRAGSGRGRGRS